MKTAFLRTLKPVDNTGTRPVLTAQRYMTVKGFADVMPLGYAGGQGCWYFYYRIPTGLVELEIVLDQATDTFGNRVTGFITDPDELRARLGC